MSCKGNADNEQSNSPLPNPLVRSSPHVRSRQHVPRLRIYLRLRLRYRQLPETQRGSLRCHQREEPVDFWTDVFREYLARQRRTVGGI